MASQAIAPEWFLVQGKLDGNAVVQAMPREVFLDAEPPTSGRGTGARTGTIGDLPCSVLIDASSVPPNAGLLLRSSGAGLTDGSALTWVSALPKPLKPGADPDAYKRREKARRSWEGAIRLVAATASTPGLRSPQIGAVHAILARWTVRRDAQTVVMPTGTGKTETMLTLLVHERPVKPVLVMVPSVALRTQVARKFETLGKLREIGVVGPRVINPVVGRLERKLKNADEARQFINRCNVVVATDDTLSGLSEEVRDVIAESFEFLFIDEAHHVAATTWAKVKEIFAAQPDARIVQFTATPFRRDGQRVDGVVSYTFPLRLAQEQNYFRPVNFRPVVAYTQAESDLAIAGVAIRQLEADLAAGHPHVIMARADNKRRAAEVFQIYQQTAPGHQPTLITSDLKTSELKEAQRKLFGGETKIIVCVDMLGEGFDFPSLKIAALHDIHKSLAITLQFTGRFTRVGSELGDATMIANVADPSVDQALQGLYGEDADWNKLLVTLADGATDQHVQDTELLQGFRGEDEVISIRNIDPKMATVVFRAVGAQWRPEQVTEVFTGRRQIVGEPRINPLEHLVIVVTQDREAISWGRVRGVENLIWNLHLLHWDPDQQLLFINSSDQNSMHLDLATAVCGDEAELLRGEEMYRVFDGVSRLTLMNAGLKHVAGRNESFSLHSGTDLNEAMPRGAGGTKRKTNVFGHGYVGPVDGREKVTLGCSAKGRVWSYRKAQTLSEWMKWSREVGRKILDSSISTESIINNAIIPKRVTSRPANAVPIVAEWDEDLLKKAETAVELNVDGETRLLLNVALDIFEPDDTSPIVIRLRVGGATALFRMRFEADDTYYDLDGARYATIKAGGKSAESLSAWLRENPPHIHFADGSELVGQEFFQPGRGISRRPFLPNRVESWDWTGVTLSKESQGSGKDPDSIQRRTIEILLTDAWQARWSRGDPPVPFAYSVVIDDDDANEAADVVAIGFADGRVVIHLFHCKFMSASDAAPGLRVGDLYEVCGQAQRSTRWRADPDRLFTHLLERDARRVRRGARFELGDEGDLRRLQAAARHQGVAFHVFIVQPALSKEALTRSSTTGVGDLLAAAEAYLNETYQIPLDVIASP